MTLLRENDWTLRVTAADALRAQGADPETTVRRRPLILERAQAAVELSHTLLRPIVFSREQAIVAHERDRLRLESGVLDCGEAVAARLAAAERLVAAVCTVGEALEREVYRLFPDDPVTALALDGIGSAAIEKLAAQACRRFQRRARGQGLRGVVHCWPGSPEWPTEVSQPQVFMLLDADLNVGGEVQLLPSHLMRPIKSLTLVLGLTREPVPAEHECDVCAVRGSCRYRAARER